MTATSSRPAPLWNRSFVIWLIGSAQSQLGSALASIAMSFLVLHQTGSAGKMALTLAFALLPNLLMPLAGAWIDRVNLKLPLIGADIARGVLQLLVGGLALLWGEVPLWLVYTAAFLNGLAGIFAQPAASAAVPALVPATELARANGLLGGVAQTAWLVGTLGGGFVVSAFTPAWAIVADGISFFIMAALLPFVNLPARTAPPEQTHLLADVRGGLRLMRRSKTLTFAPFMALLVNAVMAPVMVVTPKLMEQLGAGAKGYGTFMALENVGMMLASALIAALGARLPLRRSIGLGFFLTAAAYAGMWLLPQTTPLMICSAIAGFSLGILNIPTMTLLQQMVPADYLGRVMSVLITVSSFGMPVSLLILSPLLDKLPLPLWFGLGAGVLLLGGVNWVLIALSERTLPDLSAQVA